ncbi:MAG TPA: DUF262 domain-containing protein [Hanamia sp.]
MNDNNLVLKSINQLLEYNFFIPSYQRGYRWTERQVQELLEDIDNFIPKPIGNTDKKAWYCLQPIVVRECDVETKDRNGIAGTWYEVVDGQQRLTTIFLIIHYSNEMWVGKQKNPEFKINYETREKSYEFLKSLSVDEISNSVKINDSNIDFYHISTAYKTINDWVLGYREKFRKDFDYNDFQSKFKANSNVIWYDVNDGSDTYDIFTRLNIGKIQLTNSELIKALFLKKWNNIAAVDTIRIKQLQIASEWDRIENTLQDDTFWYFIYNKSEGDNPKYANRIEYIFDLLAGKDDDQDEKYTFYKYYEEFEKSKNTSKNKVPDTDAIWLKVKKYFLTFEEWFKDRELYHLIGFLIATETKVQDLIKAKTDASKTKFKQFLIKEIAGKVKCAIEKLQYNDKRIKTILLLFNIQTILLNDKSNMRFPFNLYKDPNLGWDIEHIRSQTDKPLNRLNERKAWIKDMLEYFTGEEEIEKQKEFISAQENSSQKVFKRIHDKEKTIDILTELLNGVSVDKIDDTQFTSLYEEICKEFGEDNEPSNCAISNLALLDSSTNRSYKNAFFPIKRKIILENDRKGTFIPIGTKNIFMKAYSKRFDEIMYWNKDDAGYYLSAIKETLTDYGVQ